MQLEELTNPVVRAVAIAIRDGDREAFLAAFDPGAKLTDDGVPQPLAQWADREIFRAHGRLRVDREEHDGLVLTGRFQITSLGSPDSLAVPDRQRAAEEGPC